MVLKGQWKGHVRADTRSRLLVAYAFEVNINVQVVRMTRSVYYTTSMTGIFLLNLESRKTESFKHSAFHEVCATNDLYLFLLIPLLWYISILLSVSIFYI